MMRVLLEAKHGFVDSTGNSGIPTYPALWASTPADPRLIAYAVIG
jgi:hypothetical protein